MTDKLNIFSFKINKGAGIFEKPKNPFNWRYET